MLICARLGRQSSRPVIFTSEEYFLPPDELLTSDEYFLSDTVVLTSQIYSCVANDAASAAFSVDDIDLTSYIIRNDVIEDVKLSCALDSIDLTSRLIRKSAAESANVEFNVSVVDLRTVVLRRSSDVSADATFNVTSITLDTIVTRHPHVEAGDVGFSADEVVVRRVTLSPPRLSATIATNPDAVDLCWYVRAPEGGSVRIYRSTSPLAPETLPPPLATLADDQSSYVDDSALLTEIYYYRVSLLNSAGAEVVSNQIQIVIEGGGYWTPDELIIPPKVWVDDTSQITTSGSALADWSNKGSLGGKFTQSTLSLRPEVSTDINGIRTIRFSGRPSLYDTGEIRAGGCVNTPSFHTFVVGSPQPSTSGYKYIVSYATHTNTVRHGLGLGQNTIESWHRRVDADPVTTCSYPYTTKQLMIMHAESDFANAQTFIRVNGQLVNQQPLPSPGNCAANASLRVEIGDLGQSEVTTLTGDISLIMSMDDVSDDERQRIEGWAAHKYGIANTLPINHPYSTTVPYMNTPVLQPDITQSNSVFGFIAQISSQNLIGVAAGQAVAEGYGILLNDQPTLLAGQGITIFDNGSLLQFQLTGITMTSPSFQLTLMTNRGVVLGNYRLLSQNGIYTASGAGTLEPGKVYYVALNEMAMDPVQEYRSLVIANDPIGYWPLTSVGVDGVVEDISGNGNHGTMFGTNYLVGDPLNGGNTQSIGFNIPTTGVTRTQVPYTNSGDLLSKLAAPGRSFTIMLWMKQTSLTEYNYAIAAHYNPTSGDAAYRMYSGGAWEAPANANRVGIQLSGTGHLIFTAYVKDHVNQTYRAFKNGQWYTSSMAYTDGNSFPATWPLEFPGCGGYSHYPIRGYMSDVAIFNQALPDATIETLYDIGVNKKPHVGVTSRFFRIYITQRHNGNGGGTTGLGYMNIACGLSAIAGVSGPNICCDGAGGLVAGATASVSSSYSAPAADGWIADRDQNFSLYWHSANTTSPWWIQIDFGEGNQRYVEEVFIRSKNTLSTTRTPYEFALQTSVNGIDWVTAKTWTGTPMWTNAEIVHSFAL